MNEEPEDLELNPLPSPPHVSNTKDLGLDTSQEYLTMPPTRTIASVRTYLRHASFDVAASFLTLPLSQFPNFKINSSKFRENPELYNVNLA